MYQRYSSQLRDRWKGIPVKIKRGNRYTTNELNARLRFSVGIMLAATVFVSTMAIIYAVTFVSQPLGEVQSENDKAFFSLLSTTISFLVGVISGFMLNGTSAAGNPKNQEEEEKE
jgi:hypothetical protein